MSEYRIVPNNRPELYLVTDPFEWYEGEEDMEFWQTTKAVIYAWAVPADTLKLIPLALAAPHLADPNPTWAVINVETEEWELGCEPFTTGTGWYNLHEIFRSETPHPWPPKKPHSVDAKPD